MVVVDKVSPVGAGSVSAGRQGALVAEPRPRPHPRQHQPRDHTGLAVAAAEKPASQFRFQQRCCVQD